MPVVLVVIFVSIAILGPISTTSVYAAQSQSDLASSVAGLTCFSVNPIGGGLNVNNCIAWISFSVLTLVSNLTTFTGAILEKSIQFSILNFKDLAGSGGIVDIGWVILRDLANLAFIFLVLWVAISTILGLGSGGAMKSVLRIAIAALLINFSLLIGKAVIDVANVFALHFYNLIIGTGTESGAPGSFTGVIMEGLAMQTIYDVGPGSLSGALLTYKIIIVSFFGSILLLVASWVFLSAAFLFLVRSIYLIILLILAPIAFIAWVIPGMGKHTHDWWSKLLNQSFFAPIFMILMYIVGKFIQSDGFGKLGGAGNTMAGALNNLTDSASASNSGALLTSMGIFMSFFVVIGLMVASLIAANKLGIAGSKTMIDWGKNVRGFGQSWVGGNKYFGVGRAARWAEERLGKTYFGNTAVGKKFRELTVIPLKDNKWGGKLSAEDRHKEDLELESKRKEALEVQGGPLTFKRVGRFGVTLKRSGEHNAENLVSEIEETKTRGNGELVVLQSSINTLTEAVKTDPTRIAELEKAKEEYKGKKQEIADELEKSRGELQKILVKLTPHAFAEMMPKNLLFTPELMRNASRSQMMAVLNSDHFAEIEKDKVRVARYGHIKDASDKLDVENQGYNEKYQKYIEESQTADLFSKMALAGWSQTQIDSEVNSMLDRMGLVAGSTERSEKEKAIRSRLTNMDKSLNWALPENTQIQRDYALATNDKERDDLRKKFLALSKNRENLDLIDIPVKKMIGDVAPDVRAWMRAMADQEADEMYRYNPQMVLNPNVAMTLRSSVTKFMRGSENVASIDKDKMRDAKFTDMIAAEDLVNGIGELAPTFKTFTHMLDSMIAVGYEGAKDIKDMIPDANAFKKYQGSSKENIDNWEQLKEDYLRKAVKKIAFEKGKYAEYVKDFNPEQIALANLGEEKIISAIGGKSADEFTLMRGARWRDPAFAKYMNRNIIKEFGQKDTGDIKEVMDMVLFDFKKALAAKDISKVSQANLDLLSWVVNDRSGKTFRNKEVIAPELQETFDKMLLVMNGVQNINKDTLEEIKKRM